MAFRRPKSCSGGLPERRIATAGRSVHKDVGPGSANTSGGALGKPFPPPYPYNSYEDFGRRVRTFPIADTGGRAPAGRARGRTPPGAPELAAASANAGTRGLLMLVQPKMGQSIESFTPSAFFEAACDVVGRPLGSRLTARGGLLVQVGSAEAARKLLKSEALCGIAVDVSVPRSQQHNVGRISGVTRWYTDEEIADQLSAQGVIQARRVKGRGGPSDAVVLVFMPGDERPRRVTLGAAEHDVEDCRDAQVPQCFHCQRMGHVAKHCLYNSRCGRCSGPHPSEDCTAQGATVRCANCGQGHLATLEDCPARLKFTRPSLGRNAESTSSASKS